MLTGAAARPTVSVPLTGSSVSCAHAVLRDVHLREVGTAQGPRGGGDVRRHGQLQSVPSYLGQGARQGVTHEVSGKAKPRMRYG